MSDFIFGGIVGMLIASSLLVGFVLYTLSQTLDVLSGRDEGVEDDDN